MTEDQFEKNIEKPQLLDIDSILIADIDAQIAAGRKRRLAANSFNQDILLSSEAILSRTSGQAPGRFNFLSLPAWLAVVERAGVPFIPAREIASLDADLFSQVFDGVQSPEFTRFMEDLIDGIGKNEILRMEQCAPDTVKSEMGYGRDLGDGLEVDRDSGEKSVDLWSPRFFDTFMDLGHAHVRGYARPKAATVRVPGEWDGIKGEWPVEFRVFVQEGVVTGVSAYYPQAPLEADRWLGLAREAGRLAEQIVASMADLNLGVGNGILCGDRPADRAREAALPGTELWGPQDFTMDFLLDAEKGHLVFLEGGPGGWRQAAPCCFETGPFGEEALCGVKLALDGPVYPFHVEPKIHPSTL